MGIALTVAFAFAVLLWVRVQVAVVRARATRPAQERTQAHHDALLLGAAASRVRRQLRSEAHRGRIPGPSGALRIPQGPGPERT